LVVYLKQKEELMKKEIQEFTEKFLEETENKPIRIISHHDTDGITSAAITSKTLKRLDKKFSLRIVKGLDEEIIKEELQNFPNNIFLFTDLASGSIKYLEKAKQKVFIIDHHEIECEIPNNIKIINPHLIKDGEETCGAGLCYLFSKSISEKNKDLAKLAIIGMIGDRHETNVSRIYQEIIHDAEELEIKKGLLIFSATRPLRRSLEYSTSFYIPGVTGSGEGVRKLLRELGISPERTLNELGDDEMQKLVTSIMVRRASEKNPDEIIGNIYLLKFFNRKEDVREISVLINACSRLGNPDVAVSFCLEKSSARLQAQDIYSKYKQELISGLRVAEKIEKVRGNGYVILNAKEKIKDALIGTICSMISSGPTYESGTILIGMAYNKDKVKISARIAGRTDKNLKEVLEKTVINFEAEVGGHKAAAGALIRKEDEEMFIQELMKNLQIDVVKM
jgi:single-stranded-DNA-specific exonuclease